MSFIIKKDLYELLNQQFIESTPHHYILGASHQASMPLKNAIVNAKRCHKPRNRAKRVFETLTSNNFIKKPFSTNSTTNSLPIIMVNSSFKNKPGGWFANVVSALIQ